MRIGVAIGAAVVGAVVVGGAVFYRLADVEHVGWRGGPEMLASGMGGLFAGGLAGLVIFIVALRWRG